MSENNGYIAEGRDSVELFRLISVKSAIKLEALGMRHSCGKSVRKMWAVAMGLKPSAKAEVVITAIQEKIDALAKAGAGFRKI